ncbi:MAG: GTPase HflX [Robiginitomaculum sp.]|nr:GTPase HflX [Robiginitomaculum sp.]
MIEVQAKPQHALVLHPVLGRESVEFSELKLAEAVGLAEALGVEIKSSLPVTVRDIKAGSYFGSGKIEEVSALIAEHDINLVVINAAIAPIQQRNLEETWNAKVIDRTGLILEIFALRAATKEGRLQVELARLGYERSRLVRTWTHLERQRGGQGFLAGPGETQIESDRRMLADKIGKLGRDLEQVRRRRALQRTKRRRAPERVVALVGYTNAGKSSLFNRLTTGGVLVKDMLFATLDTTHRILPLPSGQQAVMSDTVGFISDLPTDLVDAFRATLEEVKEADLLIHVRDMSDPLTEQHKQDVLQILDTLGAGPGHEQALIEVWNKIDLLDTNIRDEMLDNAGKKKSSFPVSCTKNIGLDKLIQSIETELSKFDQVVDVTITPKDMHIRAWLYQHGSVLSEDILAQGNCKMQVRLTTVDHGKLQTHHPQVFV